MHIQLLMLINVSLEVMLVQSWRSKLQLQEKRQWQKNISVLSALIIIVNFYYYGLEFLFKNFLL